MKKEIITSIKSFLVFSILCSLFYPLFVCLTGYTLFHHEARGSLIRNSQGTVMGSELIAQNFFSNQYFHPRPSSAGKNGYDATASSASNLSVTSKSLIDTVASRTNQYRELNHMSQNQSVPVDAVLGSGSGLDPHITVSNAIRQAPRVAKARDMNIEEALNLINACIEKPFLGFMGEKRVNIMRLNALLDKNSSIIKK